MALALSGLQDYCHAGIQLRAMALQLECGVLNAGCLWRSHYVTCQI